MLQTEKVRSIIEHARTLNRSCLVGLEANELLKALQLEVVSQILALTLDEALRAANKLRYPVMMEPASADTADMRDASGTIAGIRSDDELRQAYAEMMESLREKAPGREIPGVLIQAETQGVGVMVAGRRDDVFGPVVLFGPAGKWVEFLKDVKVHLCPVSESSARQMVSEIRAYPVLDFRKGSASVDFESVVNIIGTVCMALQNFPEIQELEINPLVLTSDGREAFCAGARAYLGAGTGRSVESGRDAEVYKLAGESFRALFDSKRIAVVGGSMDASKIGGKLVSHILKQGYEGQLVLVNPKESPSGPLKVFPSVGDIPDQTVDAALIVIPAESSVKAMQDCARKGVKVVAVYASGFRELGGAGADRELQLREAALSGGVRFMGPNMIGFMRPERKLYAEFTNNEDPLGVADIGIATQSGALGAGLIDTMLDLGLGLSSWISTGNEADLDMADAIDYFVHDEQTRVIVCYLEGVTNGNKLRLAASEAMLAHKPVIVCKAGITPLGKNLAKSHTGAFAVDDVVFESFCAEYGIVRAADLGETLEYARAFSMQPLPRGNRLAVISVSGGGNVIATDAVRNMGVAFPELSRQAQEKLASYFPQTYVKNPVDTSTIVMTKPQLIGLALDVVLQEEVIDGVIVVVTTLSEPQGSIITGDICKGLKYGKPIFVVSPFPHSIVPKRVADLKDHSIPVYRSIESAARSLAAMMRYSEITRNFPGP